MRKLTTLIAMLALMLVPVGAADAHRGHGTPGKKQARAACKQERQADPAAFQAKYANKNGRRAMRRCVRAHLRQARQTCRAEREADPDAFAETYGTNDNRRNAFGKCVSRTAREMEDEDDSGTGGEENAS